MQTEADAAMPDHTDTPRGLAVTVAIMMAASALVAGTTLLAKVLGTGVAGSQIHPFQITAGRYLFAMIPILLYAIWKRPRIVRPRWGLHIARVACAWTGVTAMFMAAGLIPLSDATAISFLNPMFTMLFAIPILGETVGPRRWSAALLALFGALLLIRPGGATFQPAALIPLGGAVVLGLEAIIVKFLTRAENRFQILLISNSIGTIAALAVASLVWIAPSPAQWAALASIGLLMVSAQILFRTALARGDASFVMPLFYATLVYAALYDLVIFGVIPHVLSIAGGAIILLSALLMAWSARRRQDPATS